MPFGAVVAFWDTRVVVREGVRDRLGGSLRIRRGAGDEQSTNETDAQVKL